MYMLACVRTQYTFYGSAYTAAQIDTMYPWDTSSAPTSGWGWTPSCPPDSTAVGTFRGPTFTRCTCNTGYGCVVLMSGYMYQT